nr:MAG TPA: hypothetical protein [Caudoviricetes sp.]
MFFCYYRHYSTITILCVCFSNVYSCIIPWF